MSDTTSDTATLVLPRLKRKYHDNVKGNLKDQLGLANVMQVPRLEKIVINMGVGKATQQPSLLEGSAWRDKRVRMAANLGIDRADLVRLNGGLAEPAFGLFRM